MITMQSERTQWMQFAQAVLEARDRQAIAALAKRTLEADGLFRNVRLQLYSKPQPKNHTSLSVRILLESSIAVGQPLEVSLMTKHGIWGVASITSTRNVGHLQHEDIAYYEMVLQLIATALERQQRFRKMESLSMLDDLTGCYNRRYLYDLLHRTINSAKRKRLIFSLVVLDLDDLKAINDQHGHLIGDKALCVLGQLLQDSIRDTDVACRYGGDEFVLVLSHTSAQDAEHIAQRLLVRLHSQQVGLNSEAVSLTASVGIAQFPDDGGTIEQLIDKADQRCYRHKNGI